MVIRLIKATRAITVIKNHNCYNCHKSHTSAKIIITRSFMSHKGNNKITKAWEATINTRAKIATKPTIYIRPIIIKKTDLI